MRRRCGRCAAPTGDPEVDLDLGAWLEAHLGYESPENDDFEAQKQLFHAISGGKAIEKPLETLYFQSL